MEQIRVGTIHKLHVERVIDTGYVLTNGKEEVLLHHSEAKEQLEPNQEIEVFLYQDKKDQLVATMFLPSVRFDTFDWAEVVEVVRGLGVFVNIGIQKEVLVSNDNLPLFESVWPKAGDMLYVILDTDKKGRLVAKPVTEEDFEGEWEEAPKTLHNQQINGRVFRTSREGAVILTEEGYRGFIHHTERKREPRLGEWVTGRVIAVKEDGTLNVSLLPLKQEGMIEDAEMIVNYLQDNDGEMLYHDKSDAAEIQATFSISKSAFKRALGKLMKENRIEQENGQTRLK